MKLSLWSGAAAVALLMVTQFPAAAEPPGDPTAVKQDEDGIWRDKAGEPTFKIEADGTVDWETYSGYRRYNSECIVCHGPDGSGSTYAPALKDSLKTMPFEVFYGIVVSGRKDLRNGQDKVMPAFANNKNVMCYLTDIYIYLRARSVDAVGRGRPAKHAPKSAAFDKNETKCMADD